LESDKQDEILEKIEAKSDFGLGWPKHSTTTQEHSSRLGVQRPL